MINCMEFKGISYKDYKEYLILSRILINNIVSELQVCKWFFTVTKEKVKKMLQAAVI